jgi:hypothetical protein
LRLFFCLRSISLSSLYPSHLYRILLSTLNSLFSLYWDVFVDWSLCSSSSSPSSMNNFKPSVMLPSAFLGRPLIFTYPIIYYSAIIFNSVCRFLWVLKISSYYRLVDILLDESTASSSSNVLQFVFIDFILKLAEIIRRCVWLFFRIEREFLYKGLS